MPSIHPVVTTGVWQPFPGKEDQFTHAWEEFARWSSGLDGAGEAILARDLRAEGSFVSFMGWASMDAVRGWKQHSEFKERMSRVQQFIDKFAPTETEVVARVGEQG